MPCWGPGAGAGPARDRIPVLAAACIQVPVPVLALVLVSMPVTVLALILAPILALMPVPEPGP